VVHLFEDVVITSQGVEPYPGSSTPLAHGYTITPPNPTHPNNPPPGLLRWHYLQCVIRRFKTVQFQNLANIVYHKLDLRMEDDSDNNGSDNEADWPSKIFDSGRAADAMEQEYRARMDGVARWNEGVGISVA
jgi:hypothetical protein